MTKERAYKASKEILSNIITTEGDGQTLSCWLTILTDGEMTEAEMVLAMINGVVDKCDSIKLDKKFKKLGLL